MKNPDVFQRKRDCNTCGQPDCNLGYPTPIGFRFFCSPICANVYLGYPLDFDIELDEQKYYFFESEGEDESNILPLHSKVRSYDFVLGDKILDDSNYMEGYIVKFAPVQNCSPDCNHYHIMTTRIIRNGVEVPLDDETWAGFFTTHWDNAGILPLPDDPDDITKVKDAEEFAARTSPSPYKNCVKNGFSLFGRKIYYDCRQAGSIVPSYIVNPESHGRFTYDEGTTSLRYVGVPRETHFDILDTVSNQMKPDKLSDWREVFTETNKLIQESLKAEDEPENPKGPHYCDDCGHYYGRKVMIKGKDPKPTTTCLCGRKERARKMEDESAFGRKLKKLREEEGLSTNYYDKERPTVYDDYPREEPSGAIGTERRKEHWPPTSGMHWYDEIGEQMTFWTVPSWHTACIQCGIKSSKGGLLQVDEGSLGSWEEPSEFICGDCVNEGELLWWAITGAKPDEPRNPLLKGLLAESFATESFRDKMELGGYLIADGTPTKVSVSKDALDNFGKRKIIDEFQERIENSSQYVDAWVYENFHKDYEVLRVRWEDI